MQNEKHRVVSKPASDSFLLPRIDIPIIVEGRYDKSAILGMFRATVITTEGFGVFNSQEKQALIRKIGKDKGVILLTDSDGGGIQIRAFLSGLLPKEKIYQLYIPQITGKEKRKRCASKAGTLGVEGVGGEILRSVLSPFVSVKPCDSVSTSAQITPTEFYFSGLSGGAHSQLLRDRLCTELGLPRGMSAKALLAALNVAVCRAEYENALKKLKGD